VHLRSELAKRIQLRAERSSSKLRITVEPVPAGDCGQHRQQKSTGGARLSNIDRYRLGTNPRPGAAVDVHVASLGIEPKVDPQRGKSAEHGFGVVGNQDLLEQRWPVG
jgi:hypothetical protein